MHLTTMIWVQFI